jgi:hypothetical protein
MSTRTSINLTGTTEKDVEVRGRDYIRAGICTRKPTRNSILERSFPDQLFFPAFFSKDPEISLHMMTYRDIVSYSGLLNFWLLQTR